MEAQFAQPFVPKPQPVTLPSEPQREQKPWLAVILLVLFIISLGSIAFLVYQNYQLKQNFSAKHPEPTAIPSLEAKPTEFLSPTPVKEKLTATFQEILSDNCKKIDLGPGSFFHGISLLSLPVSIEPALILKYRDQNTLACTGDQGIPKSQYVMIETKENTTVNLYDKNSTEGGHGGPPFLGSLPNLIGEKNGILFSMSLSWPHGGCALLDYLSVYVRGLKTLKLSNGETVFINTQLAAIEPSDQRLREILSKNTHPCELEPDRIEVDYNQKPEEEIKNKFFTDLNNLAIKEQQAIEKITQTLNAISPK